MTEKQQKLMSYRGGQVDTIVYGGARGGGKTLGASGFKAALDICEEYSEKEFNRLGLREQEYRMTRLGNMKKYYKLVTDYPEYRCAIVRRTESSLLTSTKTECDKVYPGYGGKFNSKMNKYVFPSGAEIYLRPVRQDRDLDWFQGQNLHRLVVEELTQFRIEEIEKLESAVRSSHKHIRAMKIYTTNPGGIGHSWVRQKYIDVCPPKKDGKPIYLSRLDLEYQPLRPNRIHVTREGERYIFIPSLVFDNPHLSEKDEQYIRNLMNKNEILKRMWLYGDWGVFAGQFFDMWNPDLHVMDEFEFYGVGSKVELIKARKTFDWSDYRLFRSFDYGYGAPWACGAYAVNNYTGDIIKFAEIVEKGLTSTQQAKRVNEFFKEVYNLENKHFEMNVADPKSYWQKQDRKETFKAPREDYEEQGIMLSKGINERIQGAMAVLEALRIRDNDEQGSGYPRMRYLSCCDYSIETMPNLPTDEKNPNDVDTKAEDHSYDSDRYFLMKVIGEYFDKPENKRQKKSWRDKIGKSGHGDDIATLSSWKVA